MPARLAQAGRWSPRPEHNVPERRRDAEMTVRRLEMMREVILPEVAAQPRRHAAAMNVVVQQIVGEIAVNEPGERRRREAPEHQREREEQQRRNWQRESERHHPTPRIVWKRVVRAV